MDKIKSIKIKGNEYQFPCKCFLYHKGSNTITDAVIEWGEKKVNGYYDPDEDFPDEAWKVLHFYLSSEFFNGMRAGFFYTYGGKYTNLDDIDKDYLDNYDKKEPLIFLDERKAYEYVIKECNSLINSQNNKIKEYTKKIEEINKN